jgi:N-acetyl-anhydromuramyl-L-alanine amidase AmpD
MALARYCTGPKNLPTTQYTYFVARDGRCFQCVADEVAFWHDHTGYPNHYISIGMAGYWHQATPPPVQLTGMAILVDYLMVKYKIPLAEVQGHKERAARYGYRTECPGWDHGWRELFFGILADIQDL